MNKKLLAEKRERFLSNLVKEAIINVLAEQEEMQMTPPPAPAADPMTQLAQQAPGQEELPLPTPEPGDAEPVEFTVDTLVDKLNILRGGKSLKDPEVYGKLTTFFNNLTDEQKTSSQWILDELTKIVTQPSPEEEQPAEPEEPAPAPQTPPAPPAPPQAAPPAPAPAAPVTPTA